MSRSGYSDDYDDNLAMGRWRGAVNSAIRGRCGQAFLKDLLCALEALPDKRLISGLMEEGGAVCAIGALGKARGVDMTKINTIIKKYEADCDDEYIGGMVAKEFGIAPALAREIMFINDGDYVFGEDTDETRYQRVVRWVRSQLKARNQC